MAVPNLNTKLVQSVGPPIEVRKILHLFMSYFETTQVKFADSPSQDAFSRLRVSNPETLFAVQSQYNTNPRQMESGATGTGVAPAHDANTRMMALACTAGSGTSFTQSYQYIPYQPGKSQLVKITGVLGAAVAGAICDVGYFDAANGIFLRQNGTSGLQVVRRTSTTGSVGNNAVNQADWNIDKMDGTGASGINLVATNCFILIIDLQFLGMGRVRIGFDVDGLIYYAHEFLNANVLAVPYMQTGTLPVQMLVTSTATATTKTAHFKCAAVESEGGINDADAFTVSTPEAVETAASGARTHLLSLRPKTTFNSITNRQDLSLVRLNLIATGANPVYWELCVGATMAASTWADVNTTSSGAEYTSVRGAFTNLTNGIVIVSGYISGAGGGTSPPTVTVIDIASIITRKYPISLDRAGAVRDLGTLTLLVTGIGGASATRGSIVFKEVR